MTKVPLAEREVVRKAVKQYYLERRRQGGNADRAERLARLYAEDRFRIPADSAATLVGNIRREIEDE